MALSMSLNSVFSSISSSSDGSRDGKPVKRMELVNLPTDFAHLAGVYELSRNMVNGEACWGNVNGRYFLFQTADGCWVVDDRHSMRTGFSRKESCLVATRSDSWPHKCEAGTWQARSEEGRRASTEACFVVAEEPAKAATKGKRSSVENTSKIATVARLFSLRT